jgi:riboflavin-specific deaminase-like protein
MRTLIGPAGPEDGPEPSDTPLEDLYADVQLPGTPEDPRISLGMVSSVDGAVTVEGRSGGLGGAADRAAFRALRAACDAILVGAGTVRDEGYGPPRGSEDRRTARERRGLAPVPRLVILSGSLAIPTDHRVFENASLRPVLVTHAAAPAHRRRALAEVADIVTAGRDEVDLPTAVAHLGRLGLGRILCEGGPRLNAALLAADLVEEVFLTLAPVLVGGEGPRITAGAGPGDVRPLALVEARVHDHELVLRYRRGGGRSG